MPGGPATLDLGEAPTVAVTQEEALVVVGVDSEHVVVELVVAGSELIHLDVNDALHVAALKSVASDFLRECRQLYRLIKDHEFLLRL